MIRSYLEPCIGTLERAREFERAQAAASAGDRRFSCVLLPESGR